LESQFESCATLTRGDPRPSEKKEPAALEYAISFQKRKCFMRSRNFLSHVALTTLLICARVFSAAAQEPTRTSQGAIATFAPIVEKVAPTVVTVFTTQSVSQTVSPFPFSDEALREFFGEQVPQRQGKQTLEGLGSGVIVTADGYILTANHVVAKADEIMVGSARSSADTRRRKLARIRAPMSRY
jgi:S1-C subfamily serine protease